MSALAPVVDDKIAKIVTNALNTINNSNEDDLNLPRFPTLKDNDPENALKGSYMALEAKHIFVAVMVSGKWNEFHKLCMGAPDPAKQPADYNITEEWAAWPSRTMTDGLVGHAADAQIDTLAQLAFLQLMHSSQQGFTKKYANHAIATESAIEAALAADEAMETEPVNAPALAELAAPPYPVIPAPVASKGTYRLTRDWPAWPSAGLLNHEVSNTQQAQCGMMADVMYETLKGGIFKTIDRKTKKAMGPPDDAVLELVNDVGAQNVYFDLLDLFKENGGTLVTRVGTKRGEEYAHAFCDFVVKIGNDPSTAASVRYLDDYDRPTSLPGVLTGLVDDGMHHFFVRACKAHKNSMTGKDDGSVVGPSLADTASIRSSIATTVPPSVTGLAPPGSAPAGTERGRGRGRGRGRPRGSGTRGRPRSSGTRGARRARGAQAAGRKRSRQDDEDDNDENSGDGDDGNNGDHGKSDDNDNDGSSPAAEPAGKKTKTTH